MPNKQDNSERSQILQKAISRWEAEGGAGPGHPGYKPGESLAHIPPLSNAELVQLQTRVIALENLVIALMADASSRQLELAREMSACIRPQPGYTAHPLTIHAAALMEHIVERSTRIRVNHKH
jgi:hypothetical protein